MQGKVTSKTFLLTKFEYIKAISGTFDKKALKNPILYEFKREFKPNQI